MSQGAIHTTQVDLDGLMEVLANNLYSTPLVVIRELVQNAHDSCVRRRAEDQAPFEPQIVVYTDAAQGRLVIEDNGAGMTHAEIVQYLATIGAGYTRLLRNRNPEAPGIGYFGLGFLSAYVVADLVELWTTSYREPAHAWRFSSKGAARYTITPATPNGIGTRTVLHLAAAHRRLADPDVVARLLTQYCQLLPIPIFLNGKDAGPVNQTPPWRLSETHSPLKLAKLRLDFARRFETRFEPLCVIPIEATDGGEARGMLWIQDGSTYGGTDNRNASLFLRGMLVTADARELLPSWAGFVGGVIDTETLMPTASREDVQRNDAFFAVQAQIADALVKGLKTIAQTDLPTWRRILARHNEALLGAALANPPLFDVLANDLKVPTSEGDLTLPALLGRGEDTLYISTGEGSGHEEVILRAQKIPVVAGQRYAAFPFCRRYVEQFGKRLVQLGTQSGDERVFPRVALNPETDARLRALFGEADYDLVPTSFDPDFLPLVLIPNREAELKRLLEADEADRRISQAILGMARLYTAGVATQAPARLYLNLKSPVIDRLCRADPSVQRTLATLLLSMTQLIAGHSSSTAHAALDQAWRTLSDSLLSLLTTTE